MGKGSSAVHPLPEWFVYLRMWQFGNFVHEYKILENNNCSTFYPFLLIHSQVILKLRSLTIFYQMPCSQWMTAKMRERFIQLALLDDHPSPRWYGKICCYSAISWLLGLRLEKMQNFPGIWSKIVSKMWIIFKKIRIVCKKKTEIYI